jgi:hypothetical protein
MDDRKAASGQHRAARPGSTRRTTFDVTLYCEPDSDDYENLVSPKTLVNTPRYARGRIKDALVQVHGIITARLAHAERPYDVATEQGLLDEIRALGFARREGGPADWRCARLTLAATLILLAERDDRPPPPAEGKRARAASRPKLDLSVDEAA